MSSRLVALLAVDWKDLGHRAEEVLQRFQEVVAGVAGEHGGELLDHPVKLRPERRIYLFSGPSACLQAARALRQALLDASLQASLALHTGECMEREGQLLGAPLGEVAELAEAGEAGDLAVTEVFRLTLPLESQAPWVRQDQPQILAGNPWTVSRWQHEGGA